MSLSASVGGHLQLKKIALTPLPLSGRPSNYQRLASSEPPQGLPKSASASCAGFQKLEFQTVVNRPQIRTTSNLPSSATDHQNAAPGGTTMSPPPRQEVVSPGAAQAAMLSSSPIMQAAAASTTPAKPNLQMLRLLRTSLSVPRLRPATGLAAATSTSSPAAPSHSQHPQQLPVRAHLAFSRPTMSEIRRVVATTNGANGASAAAAETAVGIIKSRSHAQNNVDDEDDIVLQQPRSSTPVPHKLVEPPFNPRGRAAPSSPARTSSASWSPTNGRKKQTAIAVRNARKALPLHSKSGAVTRGRATRSTGVNSAAEAVVAGVPQQENPGAVLQPRQPPHPHTGGGSPSARIVHEIFFKKCEHIPGVVVAAGGAAKNRGGPGFLAAREQRHELEPEHLQEDDDGNKKKPAFRLDLRAARDGKSAWDEVDRFAGLKLKSKAKPHCPRRRGAAAATSQHLAQRYNAACVQLKKTQEKAVAKAENFSASTLDLEVGNGLARRERARREIQRLWNATVDRNAAMQGSKSMKNDNSVVRFSDGDAAIKGEKSSLAANGEQLVELEKLGDIFQHDRGASSLGPTQRRAHERDRPESVAEAEGAGDGDEEVVDVQPDDLLSKVVPGGRPSSPPESPAPASNPPAHQWLLDEVESLNREVVQEGGRGQLPAQRNKRNNNEHSSTGSTVQTEVERTTLSPKVDCSHTSSWSPDLEAVLRAEEEDVALLEQVPPATRAGQKFLLKDISRDLEIDFDPGFYSGSGESSSRKDDHQLTPRSPPMHHFPVHEQKLRLQYHCLRKSARVVCTQLAQLHAKMLDMGVFPPRFELELENQILVGDSEVDDRGTAAVDVQEQETQTPVVGRREVGVDAPVLGDAASHDNASGGGAPERINEDEAPGFVDDEDEDEVLLGDSGFGALLRGDAVHGLDGLGDTVFDVENEAEASGSASASIEEVITFVSERLGGGEHSPLRYPPPATHSSNYLDAVVQVDDAVNVVNDDGRMDDEEVDVIPTVPGGAELDNSGGCGESSSAGVPDEEEPFAGPGAVPVPVAMKTKSTGQPRVGHVQLGPRGGPSASGAASGVAVAHEQRADLLSRTLLTCCYAETPTSPTKIQPLRLDFLARSTTDLLTAELKVPLLGSSTTTTTGPVVLGNSCPGRSSLGGPGGEGGVLVTNSYTTTSAGRGGRAATTGTTGVTTSASRQQHKVEKEEFSTDVDRTPKRLKNRASRVSITADAAPVGD